MAMQPTFSVINAEVDYSNKTITVFTNFAVDQSTVNYENIKLFQISQDGSDMKLCAKPAHILPINNEITYQLKTDKKKIIIKLNRYPEPDAKFYLIVQGIHNKLGMPLNIVFDKTFYFNYDITTKTKIISQNDELVTEYDTELIDITIATFDEKEPYIEAKQYRVEVSNDVAFFNGESIAFDNKTNPVPTPALNGYCYVSKIIKNKDNTITVTLEFNHNGQYYIRARVENDSNLYGDWSEPVSIAIDAFDHFEDDTPFSDALITTEDLFEVELKPLKIVSKTKDTTTTQEFYIEYNKNIKFKKGKDSLYTEDGLLYLGKAYMIRRDF